MGATKRLSPAEKTHRELLSLLNNSNPLIRDVEFPYNPYLRTKPQLLFKEAAQLLKDTGHLQKASELLSLQRRHMNLLDVLNTIGDFCTISYEHKPSGRVNTLYRKASAWRKKILEHENTWTQHKVIGAFECLKELLRPETLLDHHKLFEAAGNAYSYYSFFGKYEDDDKFSDVMVKKVTAEVFKPLSVLAEDLFFFHSMEITNIDRDELEAEFASCGKKNFFDNSDQGSLFLSYFFGVNQASRALFYQSVSTIPEQTEDLVRCVEISHKIAVEQEREQLLDTTIQAANNLKGFMRWWGIPANFNLERILRQRSLLKRTSDGFDT